MIRISHEFTGVDFFLPDYELVSGYDANEPFGLPVAAFAHLYLISGDLAIRIKTKVELQPYVTITTPEMALDYVRIFTSPASTGMFEDPLWIEVTPRSALDSKFLFGNDELLRYLNISGDESIRKETIADLSKTKDPQKIDEISEKFPKFADWGILSDEAWKDNGLRSPQFEQKGDKFIVRRTMIKTSSVMNQKMTKMIYWVEEVVTKTGEISSRELDSNEIKGNIFFAIPANL